MQPSSESIADVIKSDTADLDKEQKEINYE